MTLDAHMYQDPERVLMRKQELAAKKARACGECVHHRSIEFKGEVVHACIYKRRQYGVRCDLYETKGQA